MRSIIPAEIAVSEHRGSVAADDLPAAERALVSRASAKRIQEFSCGRRCARTALGMLGVGGFALLANADRTPRWPAGFVGSITHTEGYCAAAVAHAAGYAGIGIDAENVGALDRRLAGRVGTPAEFEGVGAHTRLPDADVLALVFSAKEAFFKSQFPQTGLMLDFTDVWVTAATGLFAVRPARPLPGPEAMFGRHGRYRLDGGLVMTAFLLAA